MVCCDDTVASRKYMHVLEHYYSDEVGQTQDQRQHMRATNFFCNTVDQQVMILQGKWSDPLSQVRLG